MFDYKRAHKEIAAPLYRSLPKRIHRLINRVNEECAELHQNSNLDMPWPEGLRAAFERLDTNTLAESAQIVYDFGNWGTRDCLQENGTYWKFARYCSQVLRERLGLSREFPDRGVGFGVQKGQLHVYWSSNIAWINREIGPASKGLLETARKFYSGCIRGREFEELTDRFLKVHPVGSIDDYLS